ncbi:hypothetical protein AB0B50_00680 [Streptomyces sp. NPDC041068]|uniref:hypothetical protein n=1 Tax=Streptomyces sp. NPDC041068 TaxID=3155130 RepID=UPI0033E323D4
MRLLPWGWEMDPVTVVAGTALVGAMATDAWGRVRDAVVALWRRPHPDQAESVATGLDELRGQVLDARSQGDEDIEAALVALWRMRLHQLVGQDAGLTAELRYLLDHHLGPALDEAGPTRAGSVEQNATVSGGVSIQAGRDAHYTPPDSR